MQSLFLLKWAKEMVSVHRWRQADRRQVAGANRWAVARAALMPNATLAAVLA